MRLLDLTQDCFYIQLDLHTGILLPMDQTVVVPKGRHNTADSLLIPERRQKGNDYRRTTAGKERQLESVGIGAEVRQTDTLEQAGRWM